MSEFSVCLFLTLCYRPCAWYSLYCIRIAIFEYTMQLYCQYCKPGHLQIPEGVRCHQNDLREAPRLMSSTHAQTELFLFRIINHTFHVFN